MVESIGKGPPRVYAVSIMPEKETLERAHEDAREGKSASTQAGEFVREEIHHVREGKHGVRSPQQAIAIGLSKARRAGVKLPAPKGKASARVRKQASRDTRKAKSAGKSRVSATRSRATLRALKREGRQGASQKPLSQQGQRSARRRGATSRKQAARKAVRTKGTTRIRQSARKAARTRRSGRRS